MSWKSLFSRRLEPATEELVPPQDDGAIDGELVSVPLCEDEFGELMLTRHEAEAFLDTVSLSWRGHGEAPGIRVAGELLYSKRELIAWLDGK